MRNQYNVVIVEDQPTHLNSLCEMLSLYEKENDVGFSVVSYSDIETFLTEYKKNYDIVFMDIELPGMNGMDGARRLREIDEVTVLIFVTCIAQFAVEGYAVNAMDYILKPVTYKDFSIKLDRALDCVEKNRDRYIVVKNRNNIIKMNISDVIYVESRGHHGIFHLISGKEVDVCITLHKLAQELSKYGFSLCNSCYIVNMRYIASITNNLIIMTDNSGLPISRGKKKSFLDEFLTYSGGG